MGKVKMADFLSFHQKMKGARWTEENILPLSGDCADLVAEYLVEYFGYPAVIKQYVSYEIFSWVRRQAGLRGLLDPRPITSATGSALLPGAVILSDPGSYFSSDRHYVTTIVEVEHCGDTANADLKAAFEDNGAVCFVGHGKSDSVNDRHIWLLPPGELPNWLSLGLKGGNFYRAPAGDKVPALELTDSWEPNCRLLPSTEVIARLAYNWGGNLSSKWAEFKWNGDFDSSGGTIQAPGIKGTGLSEFITLNPLEGDNQYIRVCVAPISGLW